MIFSLYLKMVRMGGVWGWFDYFKQIKNKMSIEYQLYSMSLTNHIIIPIVGSKQNLEDQNIFVCSYFNLTPQKQEDMPDLSFWKKSMSAFKKFKQKKDKKDKKHSQEIEDHDHTYQQIKRDFSKLVKRKSKEHAIPGSTKYEQYLESYKYYDPNDAPLYELQIQTNFQYKLKGIKSSTKPQKMDQELQQIKMVKIQSQNNEQEMLADPVIEVRFDDPFIIIRKDHIKKTHKSIKSKNIKKEKQFKPQDKHESTHLFQPITIKDRPNQHHTHKKEDHAFTHLHTTPLSHPANISRANKFQESENSSQQNGSNELPVKMKKQMHTLQQLVKQANQKNGAEGIRSLKQRQKLFNFDKNQENSQSIGMQ